jgi:hypothetical protein
MMKKISNAAPAAFIAAASAFVAVGTLNDSRRSSGSSKSYRGPGRSCGS